MILASNVSPAASKTVDQTYLVVDQADLTRGEFEESIQALFQAQGILKVPPVGSAEYEKARKEIEEDFIREVVLSEEADRMKIPVTDAEVDHMVDQQIDTMKK